MRVAVIIIVILGALASIGLGAKWISDYNSLKSEVTAATDTADELGIDIKDELNDVKDLMNCAYALVVGGIVAVVSVILIGKLKKLSAVLILVSAIVPAVLSPLSLVATFLLIIGGILAFFVKPKVQAAA